MKGERHYAIVGNPPALTTRTTSNKNSNTHKAERIRDGTAVEALRKAANGEELSAKGKGKGKKRALEVDQDEVELLTRVTMGERPAKRVRKSVA